MFNLIIKDTPWKEGHDTFPSNRIFEWTEQALVDQYNPKGKPDFTALSKLPTIFAEETSHQDKQVTRVGFIHSARIVGSEIVLQYGYDLSIPPIPNKLFQVVALELGIDKQRFRRTHWSINSNDLFRSLLHHLLPRRRRPMVFNLSESEMIHSMLISAMMPFHSEFDRVYAVLQEVALAIGMQCQRADDIWENQTVIEDIVSLIDRSRIVICDCSKRNPNVFYEIGIAHTLGREVILITQSDEDIPFDLRHLRYVPYLNNGEGLAQLKTKLQQKLESILNR